MLHSTALERFVVLLAGVELGNGEQLSTSRVLSFVSNLFAYSCTGVLPYAPTVFSSRSSGCKLYFVYGGLAVNMLNVSEDV
jgi:hypothetical protein